MTSRLLIGVDVAKAELVIARSDGSSVASIENSKMAIRKWLKSLPKGCSIAIEPTSSYHCEVLIQSHAAGHRAYLVDGYQVSNYRKSVRQRAKTDALDAQLLMRFLSNEEAELKPWEPPPAVYNKLRRSLQARAGIVKACTRLQQSLGALGLQKELKTALKPLKRLMLKLEKDIEKIILQAGLQDEYAHCQQIPGIGPLTAAGLICSNMRGHFSRSDAFIAFLGLDVAARDSGQKKGRRALTKQGNPEVRRLLYNAAMTAIRHPDWSDYYQRLLDRGLSCIQALVSVSRKLARVAFAVMHSGQPYQSRREQPA